MSCVYVLRRCNDNLFKVGRTKGLLSATIDQLSRGTPFRLTEFARIDTAEEIACETYLQQTLRSKKVVEGSGQEFFRVDAIQMNAAVRDAQQYVREFLSAKREAEALCRTEVNPNTGAMKPTQADLEVYSQLLNIREAQDALTVQRDFCEIKLKLRIGRSCALEGVATWKGLWSHKFDVPAFRASEPEMYAEVDSHFGSDSYSRRFCIQRMN